MRLRAWQNEKLSQADYKYNAYHLLAEESTIPRSVGFYASDSRIFNFSLPYAFVFGDRWD